MFAQRDSSQKSLQVKSLAAVVVTLATANTGFQDLKATIVFLATLMAALIAKVIKKKKRS